jgi:hypothetical protein
LTELERQYVGGAKDGESKRTRRMAFLESYFSGTTYDALAVPWDAAPDGAGRPIPLRSRRPSVLLPLPRLVVSAYVRMLWGAGRRPSAAIVGAGGAEDNALLADIVDEADLVRVMRDATCRALRCGTGCVVWRVRDGKLCADSWDAKHCRPEFAPGVFPKLERIEYRFKYEREVDDGFGRVRCAWFWHREVLDAKQWTVYRDVEMSADGEPTWAELESADHGLGFVPAVWIPVGERDGFDGTAIYAPCLSLFDSANMTASQRDRALHYNLDPQTIFEGVSEADINVLQKGGANTWSIPKGAGVKLLESDGKYVESAERVLDWLRQQILDACAVIIADPATAAGAQSGAALELLHSPMLASLDDLREDVGRAYRDLLEQVLAGIAALPGTIELRDRHKADAKRWARARVQLTWGRHFPATPTDAAQASAATAAAVKEGLVSRAAGARYLAPQFGVEDVEADQVEAAEDMQQSEQRELRLTKAASARDPMYPEEMPPDGGEEQDDAE